MWVTYNSWDLLAHEIFSSALNIDTAIRACKEEKSNIIRSQLEMQTIKENLDDGYCDILGSVGNILYVGELNTLYQLLLSQMVVSKAMWGKSDSFVLKVQLFKHLEGPWLDKSKYRCPSPFQTHAGQERFHCSLHSYPPTNPRTIQSTSK